MKNMSDNRMMGYYAGLLLHSALFVLCFSWTTSPLFYGKCPSFDSEIFQIIGKYWLQGVIPYADLWDNKGPIIFLINALGYLLTNNCIGVSFLQIIFLFVTEIFVFKSFRLFLSARKSFWLSVIVVTSFVINYDGGNQCEEYLLPLLSSFYYYLLKYLYLKNSNNKTIQIIAFLGGMTLSFSLLSRLTNACGVCASCMVLIIFFLIDKRWKDLGRFIALFFVGFIVLALPFFIYFAYHHEFKEMWYSIFTFNIEYVNTTKSLKNIWKIVCLKYHHCLFLLIAAVLLAFFKKYRESLLWLVTAIVPLIWFSNGMGFGHYGLIVSPYAFVSLILLIRIGNIKEAGKAKLISQGLIGFIFLLIICGAIIRVTDSIRYYKNDPQKETFTDCFFEENNIDTKSFATYNCDWTIYLRRDIKPGLKYFSFQDDLIDRGPSIENKVYQDIVNSHVKWILVGLPIRHSPIQRFINHSYDLTTVPLKCTNRSLKSLK